MVAFNSEHGLLIYHTGFKKCWVHISETGWQHCEVQARENNCFPQDSWKRSHERWQPRTTARGHALLCRMRPRWHMSYCGKDPLHFQGWSRLPYGWIKTHSSTHWLFDLEQITKPFRAEFIWKVEIHAFSSFWEDLCRKYLESGRQNKHTELLFYCFY